MRRIPPEASKSFSRASMRVKRATKRAVAQKTQREPFLRCSKRASRAAQKRSRSRCPSRFGLSGTSRATYRTGRGCGQRAVLTRILIALDGSTSADQALAYALALAKGEDARIDVEAFVDPRAI